MGLDLQAIYVFQSIMLIQYGPEWRECRRLEHLALSPTAVGGCGRMRGRMVITLCRDLLDSPDDFFDLVRL